MKLQNKISHRWKFLSTCMLWVLVSSISFADSINTTISKQAPTEAKSFIATEEPINSTPTNRRATASPPVISIWNGFSQLNGQFGKPGISQKWVNILGNVSSDIDLYFLSYKINGGPEEYWLNVGPYRRLERKGDFNIEIDHTILDEGINDIEIKAVDRNGRVSTKVVTIDYTSGSYWPLPYTANWNSISSIQEIENISHVVDGLWKLTNDGIRTVQTGYDRAIAIGDETWPSDNYEVTVPFTLHSDFSGIGFAVGWQGHEGTEQPRKEWPAQALAWIRGPISRPTLNILTYGGLIIWEDNRETQQIPPLTVNKKYMLKSYSEPIGNGMSRFYVKLWPQSDIEPTTWNIQADIPSRDGSVLLIAYNGDATFGNVSVKTAAPGSLPQNSGPSELSNPWDIIVKIGNRVSNLQELIASTPLDQFAGFTWQEQLENRESKISNLLSQAAEHCWNGSPQNAIHKLNTAYSSLNQNMLENAGREKTKEKIFNEISNLYAIRNAEF